MRTRRRIVALVAALALLTTACGDDDDTDTVSGEDPSPSEEPAAPAELTVTVGSDAITLSATSIDAGAVELTVVNDSGGEVDADLTQVEPGTTPEAFAEGMAPLFVGGPFPDFAITSVGVAAPPGGNATSTVMMPAGEYIVWSLPEPPSEDSEVEGGAEDEAADEGAEGEGESDSEGEGEGEESGPPPEAFIMATLTVNEAESEAAFPDTDGSITAEDYGFDVDASGSGTFTFSNDGPDQFHHAVIVDFGTNDVDTVRELFPVLIASDEDDPPPEGLDVEQVDFEFASTGVFGPGLMGTFEADFTSGNTYAVVCFISDRAGGPPHAMAYDMFEVFQAS